MTNTVTTLNGLFKERYADRVAELMPDAVVFQKDVPFVDAGQQIGNAWHQPVVLSYESGITYAAAASGAFTTNSAVAAVHKDAQVTGAQILLTAQLDYESAARASDSKRAFEKAMDRVVRNMVNSVARRVELADLFGGTTIYSGIGILQSVSNAGANTTCVITLASWAAGAWAGNEGAVVDIYDNDGSGGAPLTQRNTNAAMTVTSVTVSTRTVVINGNATDAAAMAIGDFIFYRGAFNAESLGMVNIASNSGTMFGVAGGTYSFWQGNVFSVGSQQLTMQKVFDGLDGAVARGLDEDVCLYVNPRGWTDLMSDLAAVRKFDGSYQRGNGENGFERVTFYYQSGAIQIVPHKYMPEGIALAFPKKKTKRLGSTDITFRLPGMTGAGDNADFFYHLQSNAGVGIRAYTQQAPFVETPGRCVLFTGIVNS